MTFAFLALLLGQTMPPEFDPLAILGHLMQAAQASRWDVLAVFLILGAVYAARRWGAKLWAPLGSKRGGIALAVVGGVGTVLGGWLLSGTAFTWDLLLKAFVLAGTASGWWSWGKNGTEKPDPAPAPGGA